LSEEDSYFLLLIAIRIAILGQQLSND